VGVYVGQLTSREPQVAASWAQTIGEESTREVCIEQVARSWFYSDRAAAEAWLEQVGLPEEKKNRLLLRH